MAKYMPRTGTGVFAGQSVGYLHSTSTIVGEGFYVKPVVLDQVSWSGTSNTANSVSVALRDVNNVWADPVTLPLNSWTWSFTATTVTAVRLTVNAGFNSSGAMHSVSCNSPNTYPADYQSMTFSGLSNSPELESPQVRLSPPVKAPDGAVAINTSGYLKDTALTVLTGDTLRFTWPLITPKLSAAALPTPMDSVDGVRQGKVLDSLPLTYIASPKVLRLLGFDPLVTGPGLDRNAPLPVLDGTAFFQPRSTVIPKYPTSNGPAAVSGECDSARLPIWFRMAAEGEMRKVIPHEAGTEDMRISLVMGAAPSGYIFAGSKARVTFSGTGMGLVSKAWLPIRFTVTVGSPLVTKFAANRYGSVDPWPMIGPAPGTPWVPPKGWFPHGSIFVPAWAGEGRLPFQRGSAPDMPITMRKIPYWEGAGQLAAKVTVGVTSTYWRAASRPSMKLTVDVGEVVLVPAGTVLMRVRFFMSRPKGEVMDLGEADLRLRLKLVAGWYPWGAAEATMVINQPPVSARHTAIGEALVPIRARFINFTGLRKAIATPPPMHVWVNALGGKLQPSNFGEVPQIPLMVHANVKDSVVTPARQLVPIHITHDVIPTYVISHSSGTRIGS